MEIETPLRVKFHIKGLTPLLMHADNVMLADDLEEWRKDPSNKKVSKAGDDRSPAWTWHTYVYTDGGFIAMPSDNLLACLRTAGAKVIMKKQTTFKESTQSGLFIDTDHFPLVVRGKKIAAAELLQSTRPLPFVKHVEACRKLGFDLFVKRARVGQAKHVRVRPRFDDWSFEGEVEVMQHAPELTFEVLETIFRIAGRTGLGDWRPGCKTPGRFGMFNATLQKV